MRIEEWLDDGINSHPSRNYQGYIEQDGADALILTTFGTGYTFDTWRGSFWEEDAILVADGFEFAESNNDPLPGAPELGTEPYRVHDYKYLTRSYYIELPIPFEDVEMDETQYTLEELRSFITNVEYGDDCPGMGFDYFNLPEDEDLSDEMRNA